MRREDEIHHEMFWSAAERVGLTEEHRARIAKDPKVTAVLAGLRGALLGAVSDAEILGLLLGLEMPALENIDTVFNGLAHGDEAARELAQTQFFVIHRAIETEHVRLTISNYLRFCRSEVAKAQYRAGFDAGTEFWSRFWSMAAELVNRERKEAVDIARIA